MKLFAIIASVSLLLLSSQAESAERSSGRIEPEPGVWLHYERIGNGHNFVIVPGGFLYDGALQELARPERTLILYDMRNRGASSRVERDEQISLQADIADLEAVRRHFGIEKTSLIGYSYLGMMTVLYAVDHPEQIERIVQIGPVPIKYDTEFPPNLVWRDPKPVIPAELADPVLKLRDQGFDRSNPKEFCLRYESLMSLRLVGNPKNAERIDHKARCELENEWPVNFQRHLSIHFQGSIQKFDPPRGRIAKLQTPVLTLHGTMDRNAPFAAGVEWASTLPNARLIVAPGAAHQLWLDHEEALREIDIFLSGAWPASAVKVAGWDSAMTLLRHGLGSEE